MKLYEPVAHHVRVWSFHTTPIAIQQWNKHLSPVILHEVYLSSNGESSMSSQNGILLSTFGIQDNAIPYIDRWYLKPLADLFHMLSVTVDIAGYVTNFVRSIPVSHEHAYTIVALIFQKKSSDRRIDAARHGNSYGSFARFEYDICGERLRGV